MRCHCVQLFLTMSACCAARSLPESYQVMHAVAGGFALALVCTLQAQQQLEFLCMPARPNSHNCTLQRLPHVPAGNGKLQGTVLEKLADAGVSILFVTIGPAERGKEFSKLTGFPEDKLLADPEMHIYEALKFKNTL